MKSAFSMIEITIALFVFAVISPTLMTLFSQTNLSSTASMYEVMATNYATEIGEQLLDISMNPNSPRIKEIERAAMVRFPFIVENPVFAARLNEAGGPPKAVGLTPTGVSLLLSPLEIGFATREIKVINECLDLSRAWGSYYTVQITLTWRLPGEPKDQSPKHSFSSTVFLRREPCCYDKDSSCTICKGKSLFEG